MAEESRKKYSVKIDGVETAITNTLKLKDALKSTTGPLLGLNKAVESFTGVYKDLAEFMKLGAESMEVFGAKTEFTQVILARLGRAITIINQIQAINNALLAKGHIISAKKAALDKIHTIQVIARANAIAIATKMEGMSTAGTKAATIVQAAFNLVAKMNPYILLAMALVSVVGALAMFASNTETASEKQKKLNDTILDSIALKDEYAGKLKAMSDVTINALQREYDLAKARGESEEKLALKQEIIYAEKSRFAKQNSDWYKEEVDAIEKNSELVDKYSIKIRNLQKSYYNAVDSKNKFFDVEKYKKDLEALETAHNIAQQRLIQGIKAQEDAAKTKNDIAIDSAKKTQDTAKKEEGARKTANERAKRDALAGAEYKVLVAKKGSEEELKAQIAVANQRLKNDLSNAELSKNEQKKRSKETLLQIEKLETEHRIALTKDSITGINNKLEKVKKGTLEEHNLRVSKFELEKRIELENKDLSVAEQEKIENEYIRKIKESEKEYLLEGATYETEINVAKLNTKLALAQQGSQEEFALRVQLLEATAKLEQEEMLHSIENEEVRNAKIKESFEKLQKEKKAIELEQGLADSDDKSKKEILDLTKQLEEKKITKEKYEAQMRSNSIKSLEEEIALRKKNGEDTTALETQLSNERIKQKEIEGEGFGKFFKNLSKDLEEYSSKAMEYLDTAFSAMGDLIKSQLDDAKEQYEDVSKKYDDIVAKREESSNKIAALEDKAKNARGGRALALQEQISSEMANNQKLAEQEATLAKEKEKAEKEKAKLEKKAKRLEVQQGIVKSVSSVALGMANALSAGLAGIPIAVMIGAAGAIQIATQARQLSKLADGGLLKGKQHTQGGMRIEGSNIEVEGGEYVVNRQSTDRNLGLIRYINSNRRELSQQDLNSFFTKSSKGYESPFRRAFEEGGQLPIFSNTPTVDNDMLVDAIRNIRIEPRVAVTDITHAQRSMVSVDTWAGI